MAGKFVVKNIPDQPEARRWEMVNDQGYTVAQSVAPIDKDMILSAIQWIKETAKDCPVR